MDIANPGNLLHRRLFDVNPAQLDEKSSATTTDEDYEQKPVVVVVVVTLAKKQKFDAQYIERKQEQE
jgi:hypothetical protein